MSADDIWNDPRNAQLKADRETGNVLAPGDLLSIPEVSETWEKVSVGTEQEYTADIPKLPIRVALCDDEGPIANEKYIIRRGTEVEEGSTDAAGNLQVMAGVLERIVILELPDRGETVHLCVGDLDPVDTTSGLQARLHALGYLPHYMAGVDDAATQDALLAFQKDSGLSPSGKIDDDTARKLCDRFGC